MLLLWRDNFKPFRQQFVSRKRPGVDLAAAAASLKQSLLSKQTPVVLSEWWPSFGRRQPATGAAVYVIVAGKV